MLTAGLGCPGGQVIYQQAGTYMGLHIYVPALAQINKDV